MQRRTKEKRPYMSTCVRTSLLKRCQLECHKKASKKYATLCCRHKYCICMYCTHHRYTPPNIFVRILSALLPTLILLGSNFARNGEKTILKNRFLPSFQSTFEMTTAKGAMYCKYAIRRSKIKNQKSDPKTFWSPPLA
jgi:hypothetical protein